MEETWSESPLPWTFEYTGGEHVIIDGKHKGLIVGERPDLFVFIVVRADLGFQPRPVADGAHLGGPYFVGWGTSSGSGGKGPRSGG